MLKQLSTNDGYLCFEADNVFICSKNEKQNFQPLEMSVKEYLDLPFEVHCYKYEFYCQEKCSYLNSFKLKLSI
jgi:hypothetical protein